MVIYDDNDYFVYFMLLNNLELIMLIFGYWEVVDVFFIVDLDNNIVYFVVIKEFFI